MIDRRGFLLGLAAAPIASASSAQSLSDVLGAINGNAAPSLLDLVKAVRLQIGVTTSYDPAYVSPNNLGAQPPR